MNDAPVSTAAMIEIEGLAKHYGELVALNALSLRVERGEIFALLGPNGAGKTTTMRVLMGFLKPSAGRARIAGLDCFEQRVELKRKVGYLPDEPVFYDYLRGSEIVEFSGDMHGLSRALIRARATPLIERLELGPALADYAVNYSRGMKKKLALVCALLHEPELLILDEPTSGLDPLASRRLNELIVEYRGRGATILLSSHLLDQVERLCQRIAIVHGGRVAACGTFEELRQERAQGGTLEDVFFAVTSGDRELAEAAPAGEARGGGD
ncbi:MAG TPA: ABC transporter ATP-binding protein [Polyangiaceae bacterium]|jgi:ABC-2 type transport system ATP-binding protein|nr:ABC transporter ATP-binding protein [Polyangiaceae bacterium]